MMRKIIKWFTAIIGIVLLAFGIAYLAFNENLPKGEKGARADVLANKMLQSVDKEAWDTTHVLQWTFKGIHNYLWDKKRNLVQITWNDKKVLLNPDQVSGKAWKGGELLSDASADKMVKQAWSYWCNDSFWFNAVVKCFDQGTSRSIVKLEDDSEALMISYESGGVTPGDSYLWILDENGLPKSWKMWVKIIPIGGVEFTWEDWVTLPTGAKIAAMHKGPLDLDISNIQGASSLETFGLSEDPFVAIVN